MTAEKILEIAQEEWRPVVGYEGLYEVSNFGRVRSLDRLVPNRHGIVSAKVRGKILKPVLRRGYLDVQLCKNSYHKIYKVHRLVAEAFLENPLNYPQINHKDENKKNNTVQNLEWCTAKYNNNYGTKNQRVSASNLGKKKNFSAKGLARIRASNSKPVFGIHVLTGERIFFNSVTEAANFGFNRCCIESCINGRQKEHAGYKWEAA